MNSVAMRDEMKEEEMPVLRSIEEFVREKERSEAARAEAEAQREDALRQREIAQEADRLKGEVMSIAAHDLKTPLQSIIGYSELLLEQPSGERVREYASHGARAAQRMLDIVHKMLQSEAIESGQLRPARHVVDVGRLGLATSGILQSQAEAKRQRIHASAGESIRKGQVLFTILSDETQQWEALRALYLIGDPSDLEAVKPLTGPEYPETLRQQAQNTLDRIKGTSR